ncbi:regulatory iron-sulfur-containing complex subunit RicT [Olsenella sp. Marseille-P4559]|uniref:PSP1 domain-containing protein n=1 Tax=Olsenella sp. Marseille-P4559 TaxID=2364795 RepID=UPI00103173EB|nr:regulatory iron-sulfur-containing complex subunit RicT [Olsenella sp. Marseille-P4559]
MPTVIPVKFKYAARDLWFDVAGTEAVEADHVICATERGHEIGLVTADAREMSAEDLDRVTNHAQLRPVLRVASDEDLAHAEELADEGEKALPVFRRLVSQSELDMKPVGVEYLFDGGKVVCYFSAEERVDFRQLVRDLSRELHKRIDMRQIGVREEAAVVGGWGHCGQELCCTRFGLAFEPVSIRMAKEQDLPLNSTKISGACGRLMCCLRYEFEAYRDFKGRAPKRNAVIETPLGKAKIVEYDTPKEELCLRLENGKQVRVPLAEMIASDAAVKKSKDLGCACRPDTVTRDALERLQSPDVRMALAELDRAHGVTPPEGFDDADLFVRPKRRRRRAGDGGAAEGAERRQAAGPEVTDAADTKGEQQPTRRRHRNGRTARVELAAEEFEVTVTSNVEADADAPRPTRRRRHHRVTGSATGVEGGQGRGMGAEKGTGAGTRQAQSAQQRRRTRHPGDRGGAAAQGSNVSSQGGPSRPGNGRQGGRPSPKHMAPTDGAAGQPGADGAAPKRRRRHRGGRGRRGGGEGGSAGNGAQPSAPTGE